MELAVKLIMAATIVATPVAQGPDTLTAAEWRLAYIAEGEAPTGDCPMAARLAVLYVAERNEVWYGWREPTPETRWLVQNYRAFPDPTKGAHYLVNHRDLGFGARHGLTDAIRALTIERGPWSWSATCQSGTLYAFPRR